MRKILPVCLLTLGLAGFAEGQGDPANGANAVEKAKKEVLQAEEERDQAMQHADIPVLDRIDADDMSFANGAGIIRTKAQRLDDIKSGTIKFISFNQDQTQMSVYGDTVVMTGRATSVVQYRGKVNRIPRRYTNVYIKRNGQWKLIVHYET
jgi:ketosteroid isomerase-like protein